MSKIIKMYCPVCHEICGFTDEELCVKTYVTLHEECFKKINPNQS